MRNTTQAKGFMKTLTIALFSVVLAVGLTACGGKKVEPTEVKIASLKGPTSIGLVDFMKEAESGDCDNTYNFTIAGTADEILPKMINGNLDIALVPANAAAVLYNKTNGGVQVVDINTGGVLYVVTGDKSVTSLEDLAGRTVYTTGKGTTPEYVTRYLLDKANIADQVQLEFKSEATELAAMLKNDSNIVTILPQPYVTAVCAQNNQVSAPISLNDEWVKSGAEGQMVTGVTVVRSEFAKEHPEALKEFVTKQKASVEHVNEQPAQAAELVVSYGIIEKAPIAEKAIPQCNLVCITGSEMKSALQGYFSVLHQQDAASVGGKIPGDDFYLTDVIK